MTPLRLSLLVNVALVALACYFVSFHRQQELGSGLAQRGVGTRLGLGRASALMHALSKRSVKVQDAIMGTHGDSPDGLETVKLTHPSGSEATIYKWGATATSYKDASGTEWLAVRPDAKFDGSKAISGGIPHCFPQFGPGELPQHGFARDSFWTLEKAEGSRAVFTLTDSEKTRSVWDYPFKATYTVELTEDAMKTRLEVANTGDKAFDFTGALHSYFDVSNIKNVQICGPFKGQEILDRMSSPPAKIQADSDAITITTETDQVVEGIVGSVKIEDSGKGKRLLIKSTEGWKDTVLWNPYGNENMGYEKFVCVEAAAASEPVKVQPGNVWVADMDLVPAAL
eukprot:CAMPEP_0114525288 /NCGR_PEP_ID=MMETSP0109-20121206/22334_1 /TAXON_ID=29199 /ORGANISM="Chlorarachnion reptans, Strain CCCM449" /LENGTH=340 /DNA_ID=CAMNT_0001706839 /DNA_START=120 /DNA_END=1142 /DNA_ORIENTATION=-